MSKYYRSVLNVLTPAFSSTKSMAFDGVDDYIQAPLDGTSTGGILAATYSDIDLTISLWFKLNSSQNKYGIFQWGNQLADPTPFISLVQWITPDRVRFYVDGTYQTMVNVNLGQWYNIVLTRTASDNTYRGYLDGVEFFAYDDGGSIPIAFWDSATDIYLSGGYFGGAACNVDEVAIWNSVQDVATIYNSGVPGDLSSLTPIAWYRMGENGSWKSTQWLLPENSNKDKVSNYSFEFDGVNDFINCGTGLSLLGSACTFSAWVNMDTALSFRVLHKGIGADREYAFGCGTSSTLFLLLYNGTSNGIGQISIANLTPQVGSWTHIAATYDGSGSNTGVVLYVNGSVVSSSAFSTGSYTAPSSNAGGDVLIGAYSTERANGKMDEVSVFDSVQNIATLYNSGTPTTLPTGAVAHYKMGEEATFSTNWTIPDGVGSTDGLSANMTIEDRVGEAPNSSNNSLSYNMDEADREEDVPS